MLLSGLLAHRASAAPDASPGAPLDGVLLTVAPRLFVSGGALLASRGDVSYARPLMALGLGVDATFGHAIGSGVALALEGAFDLAPVFALKSVPHTDLGALWVLSTSLTLERWAGEDAALHQSIGLGLNWALLSGGQDTVDAPTNIVSLGLKWGPKLHAGIGWSIGAATDLGLRAEASVLLDPHGTHVVRGTLFARACFRLL